MVKYFHTFKYDVDDDDDEGFQIDGSGHLEIHVLMYLIADKYDVPDLRALAVKNFNKGAVELYDHALKLWPSIRLIWEKTTPLHTDLRGAALNAWLCAYKGVESEKETQDYVKSLRELPEFAVTLAVAYGWSYTNRGCEACSRHIDHKLIAFEAREHELFAECGHCSQGVRLEPGKRELRGRLRVEDHRTLP
jgi:hypothetical protein